MSNPTFNAKMTPKIKERPVKPLPDPSLSTTPPSPPPTQIQPPVMAGSDKDKFFKEISVADHTKEPKLTQSPKVTKADEIAFFGPSATASQQLDITQKPAIEKPTNWKLVAGISIGIAVALAAAGSAYFVFFKKSTGPGVTAEPETQPITAPQSALPTKLNFTLSLKDKKLQKQTKLIAEQPCSTAGYKIISEPGWLQTNFTTQANTCVASFTIRQEALKLSAGTLTDKIIVADRNNKRTQILTTLVVK